MENVKKFALLLDINKVESGYFIEIECEYRLDQLYKFILKNQLNVNDIKHLCEGIESGVEYKENEKVIFKEVF